MKKLIAIIFAISLIAPSPAQATRCADGTYSSSTGRGTCSGHGGIATKSTAIQMAAVEANLKRQKEIARIAKLEAEKQKALKNKLDSEARAAGYKNHAAKMQAEKIAEDKRIAAEKAESQRIATELEIERIKAETDAEILRLQNAKILEDKLAAEKQAAQDKLAAAKNAILLAEQEKQLNPNNSRQYVMPTNNFTLCNEFGGIYESRGGRNCQGFIVCEQLLINKGYGVLYNSNSGLRTQIDTWVLQGALTRTPDNPSCALIKGTLTPGRN